MVEAVSVKLPQNSSSKIPASDQTFAHIDYCITDHNSCRLCQGNVVQIADFGPVPPIFFSDKRQDALGIDLILMRCIECGLVQLSKSIERDQLFRTYWYQSNLNPTMVSALADIAYNARLKVALNPNDTVIDIGCNDGTLLNFFPDQKKIGVDPAKIESKFVGKFINNYFSKDTVDLQPNSAKLITAIAMFYDLDDPIKFLEDCKFFLVDDGILVVQMTDLASMVMVNAFDNICHEHVTYWSLKVMELACHQVGLSIFDATYNDVNGGSIRLFIRKGITYVKKIMDMIDNEAPFVSPVAISDFVARSKRFAQTVTRFILEANRDNRTVDVLGASTKGNTFLAVAHLQQRDIRWAAEVHPGKVGMYYGGSRIEIVSEKHSLNVPPNHYLVLPWHFADFFRRRMSWYTYLDGGSLIVPLPEPVLIDKSGVKRL